MPRATECRGMGRLVETAGRLAPVADSETRRAGSVRKKIAPARPGPATRRVMARPAGARRPQRAAPPTSVPNKSVHRDGAATDPPISGHRRTAPPGRLETPRLKHPPPIAAPRTRSRRSAALPAIARIIGRRSRNPRSKAPLRIVRRRIAPRTGRLTNVHRKRANGLDANGPVVNGPVATDLAVVDPTIHRRASGRRTPGLQRKRRIRFTPTARSTWRSTTPRTPSCAA